MIRRLLVTVTLAALIASGLVFYCLRRLTQQARFIRETAYELSQAKQTLTVTDIRRSFGSRLRHECVGSDCSYTVTVSNRILAALHIVPYTELQSYFLTKNGTVLGNMLNLTTTVNHRYSIVAHVQIDFCRGCAYIAVHPWDPASPRDTNGIVQIGADSSAQSLRRVLSLNTDCFTKYSGCRSIADLLPTVWKQTAEMKIGCILQNDKGFAEKPTNWP